MIEINQHFLFTFIMLFNHSFNFIKDLNILFVDITNQRGRPEYGGVKKFFQSDTMLWDFVHEYLPLKQSPQKIDALNIYDLLRANNMGFTHIEITEEDGTLFQGKNKTNSSSTLRQTCVNSSLSCLLFLVERHTIDYSRMRWQVSVGRCNVGSSRTPFRGQSVTVSGRIQRCF
jgi:hypothetical protein